MAKRFRSSSSGSCRAVTAGSRRRYRRGGRAAVAVTSASRRPVEQAMACQRLVGASSGPLRSAKSRNKRTAPIITVIDWNNHLSYKRATAFAGGLALCIVHPFTFASALRRLGWTATPLAQSRRAAFFDLKNQHLNSRNYRNWTVTPMDRGLAVYEPPGSLRFTEPPDRAPWRGTPRPPPVTAADRSAPCPSRPRRSISRRRPRTP